MSAPKTLLLHGWGGSDYPHWQSWLAGKLANEYGTISFPLLDNPHYPSRNRWLKQAKKSLEDFKPETVVCHSLGCTLWFWLAQENLETVEHLILVAPPSIETDIGTINTFFPLTLPETLYAKKIDLVASDSDPYIQIDEAKKMSEKYNANLITLKNAGHVNSDSGFGEWPQMLNLVKYKEYF
jgi:predicted alpha/beta hydrolase family esterase